MTLFGPTLTPYYITQPDADYVVRIDARDDWSMFETWNESGLPGWDAGGRFYKNPKHAKVRGLRVLTVEQFKALKQ